MADTEPSDFTGLTVQLLSAYVSNNSVASEDLAQLIRSTRAALTEDTKADAPVTEAALEYVPAVSVRKSLASKDHILSLIDGKPYKTLSRHLATHGLTPAEYRERYSLPKTYPMTAPNYSAMRRELAEKIGLGRKARPTETAEPVPAVGALTVSPDAAPKKPARSKAPVAPSSKASASRAKKAPVVPAASAAEIAAPELAIVESAAVIQAPVTLKAAAGRTKPAKAARPAKAPKVAKPVQKAAKATALPETTDAAPVVVAGSATELAKTKAAKPAGAKTTKVRTKASVDGPTAPKKKLGIRVPQDSVKVAGPVDA